MRPFSPLVRPSVRPSPWCCLECSRANATLYGKTCDANVYFFGPDYIATTAVGTWILGLVLVALAVPAVVGLGFCLGLAGPKNEPVPLAWADKPALKNVGADISPVESVVTSQNKVRTVPGFSTCSGWAKGIVTGGGGVVWMFGCFPCCFTISIES